MEDTSTCTAACGDGYYLDHGNTQLAGYSSAQGRVSLGTRAP